MKHSTRSALVHAAPPTPTAYSHYASARRADAAARSISVHRSVGAIPTEDLAAAVLRQESLSLLAAAYRQAARRRERAERLRRCVSGLVRTVVRSFRAVRMAVAR